MVQARLDEILGGVELTVGQQGRLGSFREENKPPLGVFNYYRHTLPIC
jgi:hypothetical protein